MIWYRTYLATVGPLACICVMLPRGLPRDAIYLLVGVSAVVAIVVGVRRHRPRRRVPWYLFAAGQSAWVLGDALFSWNEHVRHVAPFPSSADVAYLAGYPILAVGIAMLIHRDGRRIDVRGFLDSSIVMVALGLLSWAWIAQPMLDAAGVPLVDRAIAVAYPVGDIVMLAMLVTLAATRSEPSTALRFLGAAVVLQVVADTALAAGVSDTWSYADVVDLAWLGSYLAWGACALHPQMARIGREPGAQDDLFTVRRVVVLGGAAVLPPVTSAVAMIRGHSVDPWPLVLGAVVLTILVVVRMASGIAEVRLTTRQRDRFEEELLHRAAHDPLTGLLNRASLMGVVGEALRRGRSAGVPTGLIVVDLHHVDPHVVSADDVVLASTARRITDTVGPMRPVAHLGGGQFAVLVDDPEAVETTTRTAGELARALEVPPEPAPRSPRVEANVGLSLSAVGSTDAAELLQQALLAGRRARLSPPGSFEIFDGVLRREMTERAEIEEALVRAMEHDELELHFQPVVDLRSDAVRGFEALVRWRRDGVLVPPDAFIPVAEKSDLICDLGRWVLNAATTQFAEWLTLDPDRFDSLTVAVNISGHHLSDHRIVTDVTSSLRTAGLRPRHLVVEVTETVLVDEPRAVMQLDALRAMGVAVSLDDFGTGYTSIGQLRHVPADTLKIDRSFLDLTEPGSTELIALMIAAAHGCGLKVVAEGVEHDGQLVLLKRLGCDAGQGYLLSRPLPADAVLAAST